ncbi:MAG: ester cyclase [Steroidobacteraceae bacterium]
MKKVLLGTIAALAVATTAWADPTMTPAAKNNPNVAIALGYLDGVWNQHKPVETFAKYVADDEIHYPGKPGGHNPQGLAKFLEGFPNFKYEFKHIYTDGDYVIVHSLITGCPGIGTMVTSPQPNTKPQPKVGDEVVDIFHIKNGKIVEQWDTVEPVAGTADGLY